MTRYWYDNGLPFSSCVANNLDDIKFRIMEEKKAAGIVIDGSMGEGKTTFAVHCADYFNGAYKKVGDDKYFLVKEKLVKFEDTLGLGGTAFTECFEIAKQKNNHVVIYDEAGDYNKRTSMTSFNISMNNHFQTNRVFKIFIIFCLPNGKTLDSNVLINNIPRIVFHLEKRNLNYGNFKAYSLHHAKYIIDNMTKLKSHDHLAYSFESPNFAGHFLDLTPDRSKNLEEYCIKGKSRINAIAQAKINNWLSRDDIANAIDKSREWVKLRIWQLKIKPTKRIGQRMFYSPDVINTLNEKYIKK